MPRRHPLAAGAGRRPRPAGRIGGAGREPVRLLQGPAGRAAAPDRGGHGRRGDHAALPPARGRARPAGQARLPAGRHREVPDEAVDGAVEPARPRAARADRGGRRVHGPHARLSRAHLRPALPPLLPHQRSRRRPLRDHGRHARPRRRARAGPVRRRPRRRHRAGGGLPSRRVAALARARRARDRAGRPPRRSDRPRRGRVRRGRPSTTFLDAPGPAKRRAGRAKRREAAA